MIRIPMTVLGAEKLREELNQLKKVERQKVIQAIAEARAHGDLKENAEYHAAKEKQGFIEGRIADIEYKLSHAAIIDVATMQNTGKVIFGATVHLINLADDSLVIYQLVGEDEADIKLGKISIGSPISRALIGKEEGDIAEVRAPSGVLEYEITKVEFVVSSDAG